MSKTVEKKPSKPYAESDSRSLSRDAEQDGKESHAKSRPTLDKISRMEKMMEQLMEENRTLKQEQLEAALRGSQRLDWDKFSQASKKSKNSRK